MKPVKKHYLVEINIPNPTAGQRIYLGDIPELRNVTTEQMESYNSGILSFSPAQNPVVNQTGGSNVVVTLVESSTEDIYQLPYNSLTKSLNGGDVTEYQNKRFNLPKSYITLLGTASLNAGDSVVLSFYYY